VLCRSVGFHQGGFGLSAGGARSRHNLCFLNVAANVIYGMVLAKVNTNQDKEEKLESVVRYSVRLALLSGTACLIMVWTVGRLFLTIYMGSANDLNDNDNAAAASSSSSSLETNHNLLDVSYEYICIRSFSIPTQIMLQVMNAALLARKDSTTPLIGVAYYCSINFVGDLLLVTVFGMGLRGAAIATTLAQWTATFAMCGRVRHKLLGGRGLDIFGRAGIKRDYVPAKVFFMFAAPVLVLIMGKIAVYGFMTNAAAGLSGQPTTLATHQILLTVFTFVQPFLEVLSQTTRTFLPPFTTPPMDYIKHIQNNNNNNNNKQEEEESHKKNKKNHHYHLVTQAKADPLYQTWIDAAASVQFHLLRVGVFAAGLVGLFAASIPYFFSWLLTTNHDIQEAAKPLAFPLFLGTVLAAPIAVSEGVVLSKQHMVYMTCVYVVTTLLLPPRLLRIKQQSQQEQDDQDGGLEALGDIWQCFVAFQCIRAILFTTRVYGPIVFDRFLCKRQRNQPHEYTVAATSEKEVETV